MTSAINNFNGIIRDLSQVTDRASRLNMHPYEAGNYSIILTKEQLPTDKLQGEPWILLNQKLTNLANAHILVKAAKVHVADISSAPEQTLGILEINNEGNQYRRVWGEKPTDGVANHLLFLNSTLKSKPRDDEGLALIHSHPVHTNAAMLSGHVKDENSANKVVWQGNSEGMGYIRNGIKWLKWQAPGIEELTKQTANALQQGYDAVLWDRHGIVAAGKTIKEAFGKIEVIEHTMETALKALAATKEIKWLTVENLRAIVSTFKTAMSDIGRTIWNNLFPKNKDPQTANNVL